PPPQGGREQGDSPPTCVVLEWPRDVLYRRIEARVDGMLAAGWLDEVRRLRELPLGKEASQALGYRELREYLDSACDWDTTIARIKTRTRQFAKRQLTWFRSLPGCRSCPAGSPGTPDRVWDHWTNLRSNSLPVQS
ncbi:MAG TPA: tRNA dimethylallyltransferase, partial [Fimbriiglobus sp.]|nr:tRNA dimethylallyltransferase [Fimbriiglobus sp.]